MPVPEVSIKIWLEKGLHAYVDKEGLVDRLVDSTAAAMTCRVLDPDTKEYWVKRLSPNSVEITQIAQLYRPSWGTKVYIEISAHPDPDRMENLPARLVELAEDLKDFLLENHRDRVFASSQMWLKFIPITQAHTVSYV